MPKAQSTAVAWTCTDGASFIRVQRLTDRDLVVSSESDAYRRFQFPDISELMAFQIGFEDHLIATGWRLEEFARLGRARASARLVRAGWHRRWKALASIRGGSARLGWLLAIWRRQSR